jgi:hypothetical protein
MGLLMDINGDEDVVLVRSLNLKGHMLKLMARRRGLRREPRRERRGASAGRSLSRPRQQCL